MNSQFIKGDIQVESTYNTNAYACIVTDRSSTVKLCILKNNVLNYKIVQLIFASWLVAELKREYNMNQQYIKVRQLAEISTRYSS